MDSARTAFYVAGSVLLLGGLVALGTGLPRVLAGTAGSAAALATVIGTAVTVLATSTLLTAAGDGVGLTSRSGERGATSASGSVSFTIRPSTPYPALACWTGSALLLLLVLTRWRELGTAPGLVGALLVGFTVSWGRQAWKGWRAAA